MDEIKRTIKKKIELCLSGISNISNRESDRAVAEAVEHLARAYSYLSQIKESED